MFYTNPGKTKGGKGTSSIHALHMDYHDAMTVVNLDIYWDELQKVVNDQRHFFVQHITVR